METPCKDSTNHHQQGCTEDEENEYHRRKEEQRKLCMEQLFPDETNEDSSEANLAPEGKSAKPEQKLLQLPPETPLPRRTASNNLQNASQEFSSMSTSKPTESVVPHLIFGLSNHDELLVIIIVAMIISIVFQALVNWYRFTTLEKQNRLLQQELAGLRQFLHKSGKKLRPSPR
eukprot:TRINITY_DN5071_c0_g2_i1.p1 TRINITY_DN5071_c0_g2~~TRINITY_DN5071_c0_g2_i1.p1  ORF type:complete len:204 (+),score=33.30 TRINITY_DN5071_c0_g2_i1:91-612(+)